MLPLRENQIILLILVELMTITVDICGIDDHQFKFSFHNHREIGKIPIFLPPVTFLVRWWQVVICGPLYCR
jgi:hypothetical protein